MVGERFNNENVRDKVTPATNESSIIPNKNQNEMGSNAENNEKQKERQEKSCWALTIEGYKNAAFSGEERLTFSLSISTEIEITINVTMEFMIKTGIISKW